MIFVTVGSRNYPFDRLFRKLDELYENGTLTEPMFAQIGTTTYQPKHFEYRDFISQEEFLEKIQQADLVISHGASGSIMKSLGAGKKVVTVTRLKKYGEHINDHQIQNNVAFAINGYTLDADVELGNLGECILKLLNDEVTLKPWVNPDPLAIMNRIDQFIQDNWK